MLLLLLVVVWWWWCGGGGGGGGDYYYYYYYYHHHHHHHHLSQCRVCIRFLGYYSVAAILYLQFMVQVMLFPMLNVLCFYVATFRRTCAVHNMVDCCSPLMSCFPAMFFQYFLDDFEMAPVAPVFTGIIFVFTFHMRCTSIARFYIIESSRLLS